MMGLLGTKDEAQALADSLHQQLSFAGGAETLNITPSQAQVQYSLYSTTCLALHTME